MADIAHSHHSLALPDGRSLGYARYGDPTGTPILYFHGGISSRLDIKFASERCLERKIQLIAPDRPGTGLSCRKPRRSLLDFADDVEFLLKSLEIEQCRLLSWSLAGPYAFACAYKTPHRFLRVATVGSAVPPECPESVSGLGMLIDRMLLTCPPGLLWILAYLLQIASKLPTEYIKRQMIFDIGAKEDRAIIEALSTREATEFVLESVRQNGFGVVDDYLAVSSAWGFSLGDIGLPIELFHGERDQVASPSSSHYLAKHLPLGNLRMIEDAGHFLLRTNLDRVLDILLDDEDSSSKTQAA